ncbi:sialidase family protein [Pararhodonellum marinum]|uniref:sialidase family protein n=1 Tax=Pararhodonellum marinum TaxID=2755358 RepID=UPI001E36DD59|nr:sialidase family protein [Pararhodonellum marinum]
MRKNKGIQNSLTCTGPDFNQSTCLWLLYVPFLCFLVIPVAAQTNQDDEQEMSLEVIYHEALFIESKAFAQCHASSLIMLEDGTYMVAWFAGSHEKHDDVGIWYSQGKPGEWSSPKMLVKVKDEPHWNPVLFMAGSGQLLLFFKVGKEIDDWHTWVQHSTDQGQTWSSPKALIDGGIGGRGPVRNHILVTSEGAWLAPASVEKNRVWNAFVDISNDEGLTWQKTDTLTLDRKIITGEGVIQPALWESSPGNVHMLLRTSAGKIGRSDSYDGGKSWSPVSLIDLPNNNSGIDLAYLGQNRVALAYNPVGENWGKRHPLHLAISFDNGQSWPFIHVIEKGIGEDEFSYPSLIYKNGILTLTYTRNRKNITFWKARVIDLLEIGEN